MPLPVPPRVKKVPGPLCGGPVRNAPPAARTLARGPSRTRQVGKRHREGGSNPQRRSALLAWTRKEERQTPFDPKRQRLAKCSHQGQMALVSPVHRSLNVPKVDCAACDHVALLTPDFLLRLGLSPQAKVLDLKLRVRCRGCGARGRAVVSMRWGRRRGRVSHPALTPADATGAAFVKLRYRYITEAREPTTTQMTAQSPSDRSKITPSPMST